MKTEKPLKIWERRLPSGNTSYRVDLGKVNGKRRFKDFGNKEAAEAYRNQCIAQGANVKTEVLQELDAAMRHDILACLERLRLAGSTIKEATDFFLKHSKPSNGNIDVSELCARWVKTKKGAGLSDKYLTTTERCFLGPFTKAIKNCKVMEVTKEMCEKYLYGHKEWNSVTIATHYRNIKTLFNYAIREGYATLNPLAKVEKPKKPASNAKEKVMPVEAVQRLLQFALDKEAYAECASLVLTFFCGVRAEEVTRVKWEDIRLNETPPTITIEEPKIAHQRRTNALPANAVAWLKRCNNKGKAKGIVAPADFSQRMKRLRTRFYKHLAKTNVELKNDGEPLIDTEAMQYHQNSARICFASYHIAYHEDAAKTSMLLGHQGSSVLLYSTYRALVSKDASRLYWKIRPDANITTPKPETPKEQREEEEALQEHLAIMRGEPAMAEA
jgi:integrase